jgi:hypothetical protein
MKKDRCCRLFLAGLLCLTAGCDTGPDREAYVGSASATQRVISSEERQAARALSLGNLGMMDATTAPYNRAMLCVIALEAVSQRIGQLGAPSDDAPNYTALINQSIARYTREVDAIGKREGKLPDQIARDRRQHEMQIPSLSARGQIAINCLRAAVTSDPRNAGPTV